MRGKIGCILTTLSLYPSYLSQHGFLYILGCKKSVLIVFRLFSEITVLYVVVVLMSIRGGEFKVFILSHFVLKARSLALECHFSLFGKCCFL